MDRIFISYKDDEESRVYKNLFIAWCKNGSEWFDISYNDESIGTSINSSNANYIKSKIKEKIKRSDVFLCLVGKNTYTSEWVEWEIEVASELNKKIVAVKIDSHYKTPLSLYNIGTKWAKSFTYDSIKKALLY